MHILIQVVERIVHQVTLQGDIPTECNHPTRPCCAYPAFCLHAFPASICRKVSAEPKFPATHKANLLTNTPAQRWCAQLSCFSKTNQSPLDKSDDLQRNGLSAHLQEGQGLELAQFLRQVLSLDGKRAAVVLGGCLVEPQGMVTRACGVRGF